jgi:signal transduction histidine kinase
MFGQMALLTLLLLGVGAYLVTIRPILDVLPPAAYDPLDISAQRVREAINAEAFALSAHPDRAISREFSATMAEAIRRNPDFRYYLRVGNRVMGNLPTPSYFHALGLDRLEAARVAAQAPELCLQMFRNLSTPRNKGSIEYLYCTQPRYSEFHGLTHPIPTKINRTDQAFRKMFWSNGSGFFFTVAALFLLASVVIVFNMLTIRRVARLAQSFDGNQLDLQLPEGGVPVEVLPLVRAINQLIGRLSQTQARQKFFLSAAAHELRTPLTVLRTRLELLEDAPIKEKLIGDVRRVTNLVNQLLTLMKLDTLVEVSGSLDLVVTTRKVLSDLAPLATHRGIALSFAPQIEHYPMAGGADLVEVAIANLVDNAISFTPDGGEVFVALDSDGLVSVRDFGPGLDPDKASSLFEPFVRHPSNRKGFGLGLAIVKAIATLHGGSIAARNADGRGAIFDLRFPPLGDRADTENAAPVRVPAFKAEV